MLKLCRFRSGNVECSVLLFSHFFPVFLPRVVLGIGQDSGQSFFSLLLGDMDSTNRRAITRFNLFAHYRYIFFSVAASEFQWTLLTSHDRNDLLPSYSYANSKIWEIDYYSGTTDLFMQEAVLFHSERSEEVRNWLLASLVMKGWHTPPHLV